MNPIARTTPSLRGTPPWKGGEVPQLSRAFPTLWQTCFPSFPRRGAAKRRGGSVPLALLCCALAAPIHAAPKPHPTQPLRQFLAVKNDLHLQRTDATQFSFASGVWHGTHWTHRALVFSPRQNIAPGTATLLLLTNPVPWDGLGGQLAADATGTTVVLVYDVPNQPLWNRREDNLLGYSLQRSEQTGDPTWSLAFPLARATKVSMDAVQAWSAPSEVPIKHFVLVGFSKRALGAWLVASDPRVRALVSLSYNNLNLLAQTRLQLRDWGQLSTHWTKMVGADTEARFQTPRGAALLRTWDPYSFINDIRAPKLLLDATNNDYWSLDAPDEFAAELRGPTNWLYLAGAGHTMGTAVPTLLQSSALWIRRTLTKGPLENPQLHATPARLELRAPGATGAVFNFAWSATRDFRRADWSSAPMTRQGALWVAPRPLLPASARFVAVFGAANYPNPGGAGVLQLSSRVEISAVK